MNKLKNILEKKALDRKETLKRIKKSDPAIIMATWFGSGYMFPAPGFWGTLASMPLGIVLLAMTSKLTLGLVAILVFILGLWAAKQFEDQSKSHDSSMIVIDETAGILITLLFASPNPTSILLAFLLFRLFDSAKPWPISWLDKKIDGAFGVMIDDILAGLIAGACLLGLHVYAGIG
ncbi:MAG: phosphatidylglycerophosphatase A [Bdellovibrionales bacterium]